MRTLVLKILFALLIIPKILGYFFGASKKKQNSFWATKKTENNLKSFY